MLLKRLKKFQKVRPIKRHFRKSLISLDGKANSDFLVNPEIFLKTNVVDIFHMGSNVFGGNPKKDPQLKNMGDGLMNANPSSEVFYDLVPAGANRYLLRPLYTKAQWTQYKQQSGVKAIQSYKEDPKLYLDDKAAPKPLIKGKFFPYVHITSGLNSMAQLGQVTVTDNDQFAFTGGMNGCAFVVTDATNNPSPGNYKLYHYISTDSNPIFNNVGAWTTPIRCFVHANFYLPVAYTQKVGHVIGFPATFIFYYNNSKGVRKVISQTVTYSAKDNAPNMDTILTKAWDVSTNNSGFIAPNVHTITWPKKYLKITEVMPSTVASGPFQAVFNGVQG